MFKGILRWLGLDYDCPRCGEEYTKEDVYPFTLKCPDCGLLYCTKCAKIIEHTRIKKIVCCPNCLSVAQNMDGCKVFHFSVDD